MQTTILRSNGKKFHRNDSDGVTVFVLSKRLGAGDAIWSSVRKRAGKRIFAGSERSADR